MVTLSPLQILTVILGGEAHSGGPAAGPRPRRPAPGPEGPVLRASGRWLPARPPLGRASASLPAVLSSAVYFLLSPTRLAVFFLLLLLC